MAQVPEANGPTVAPQGALPTESVNPPAGAFGGGIGSALQGLAATAKEGGQMLEQHAQALNVLTAQADASEAASTSTKAMGAIRDDYITNVRLKNANPDSLATYSQKLDQAREASGQNLSFMAKKFYDQETRKVYDNNIGVLVSHTAQQQNEYVKQAGIASISNLQEQLPSYFTAGNAAMVDATLDQIKAKSKTLLALEGQDDGMIEANTRKMVSSSIKSGIDTLRATDPVQAQKVLDRYGDQMIPKEFAQASQEVHVATMPLTARTVADETFAKYFGTHEGATTLTPNTLSNIQKDPAGYFSGVVGKPVTITSGERTPEQNAKLPGASATSDHLDNRAWDMAIPPGMTAQQVADKVSNSGVPFDQIIMYGDHVHVGMGTGLRGEVLQNTGLNQYQKVSGGSTSAIPHDLTSLQAALPKMLADADAELDRTHAGDPFLPQLKDMVETQLRSKAGVWESALSGVQRESISGIDTLLASAGEGSAPPTTMDELFKSDPRAQAWYQNLSGASQLSVQRALKANANPSLAQMNESQRNSYMTLYAESVEHPDKFALRNPDADPDFQNLPPKYRMDFMKSQDRIEGYKQRNEQLTSALAAIKPLIKGTNVENTPDNADEHNEFVQRYSDEFNAYTEQHKAPPNATLRVNMARELLLGMQGNDDKPNYAQDNFIPGWFGAEAKAQAKARGLSLTDDQVLQMYKRSVARGR